METNMDASAHSAPNALPSFLEEQTDRKILSVCSEKPGKQAGIVGLESLTEDDLAFHWPLLAQQGFGTCQIRQIVSRLSQVGIGREKVL